MRINDEKQFEYLIVENHALIMKVCLMFHHDRNGQEDLFQDICVNIWKGLSSFKGNASISTWLYRVALNTALAEKRKLKNDPMLFAAEIQDIPEELPEAKSDKVQALYAGIDHLKPTEKAIIFLYLEEKTYKQIAEIIGITEKNISVKLVRIKRKLEDTINSYLTKRGTKR
ncbi:MAG: sigma-70 family RNA polymerase sigma factor [Candidatus Marinimicrobia bacterium]|nr:sigma-70 family RNA polymerase sigma factor [Candidatus Neomarinimicrobiota bacterium]